MNRRPAGHGHLEILPSGRVRARVPLADGVRHGVGTYDTEEEADAMIAAFVQRAEQENLAPVGGMTARALAAAYADDLELGRAYAAMPNVRSIIRTHFDAAPFADWPARRVTRDALKRWFKSLNATGMSPAYQGQILIQARKIFAFGVDSRRLETNPAEGLKLPRSAARTDEPWTYLDPAEQAAFLAVEGMPAAWRLRIAFAMGTGLRANEQWCLRLADLHVHGPHPEVVVRYGSRKRGTKGHKIRRVPLIGMALRAAIEWLELLPSWAPRNPNGLVFPGRYGGFEKPSNNPSWKSWLAAAGIHRRVRWHDLRHTCGSSLVSGWWGRPWSLIEVRDLLGHASIEETERYAHLGPTALKVAAAETTGPAALFSPRVAHPVVQRVENSRERELPRHPPEALPKVAEKQENRESVGSAWATAEAAAETLVRAMRAGEECGPALVALASAVLASPLIALASAALAGGPLALDRGLELADLLIRQREARRDVG
jgi:integrase